MQLFLLRILSIVAIALVYMIYDLFNKRNVPSIFAYGTLAYGFVLTLLYFNIRTIALSTAISLIILGLGYVVYRIGQLGAADVVEFAALSLILPIQNIPALLPNMGQFHLPFILTLAINTGIIAIIMVPLYYIPKASKKLKRPISSFITKRNAFMALLIAFAYVVFMLFIAVVIGANYAGMIMLAAMLVSSFFIMLFSIPIEHAMVRDVDYSKLEDGDIIALNFMSKNKVESLKKQIKGFDRLVTKEVIERMKKKKLKEKLPVYKEAMPFAVPIFIAAILSILIGNLILLAI